MLRSIVAMVVLGVLLLGCWNRQLAGPPARALELNNKAVAALKTGNNEPALSLINEAIEVAPTFDKARANKAAILVRMARNQEAIDTLQDLVQRSPGYADAFIPLGILLEKAGRVEEAGRCYKSALKLYDEMVKTNSDPVILGDRAVALFLTNDSKTSLKVLDQILADRPNDPRTNAIRARVKENNREFFMNGLPETQ